MNEEGIRMKDMDKRWGIMAVLLVISSVFGFVAFLVGRSAYGDIVEKEKK